MTNEAKRNEDTVEPLVRLRHPSAASRLADIVELLEKGLDAKHIKGVVRLN